MIPKNGEICNRRPGIFCSFRNIRNRIKKPRLHTTNALEECHGRLRERSFTNHPTIALFMKFILDLRVDERFEILRGFWERFYLSICEYYFSKMQKPKKVLDIGKHLSADCLFKAIGHIYSQKKD